MIDEHAIPVGRKGVGLAEGEDGAYLVAEDGSEVSQYALQPFAVYTWGMVDGVNSVADMAGLIEHRHGFPHGELTDDVSDALEEFQAAGALEFEQRETTADVDPGIDWSTVLRPDEDSNPWEPALELFAARHPDLLERQRGFAHDARLPVGESELRLVGEVQGLSDVLQAAPLDHPNLLAGLELLARWPAMARGVTTAIDRFHPLLDPRVRTDERAFLQSSFSQSSDHPGDRGRVSATINCPTMLAENLIREASHQLLFALGIRRNSCDGLITNPRSEGHPDPLEARDRPMSTLLHTAYACTNVTEFDRRLYVNEERGDRRTALAERLRLMVGRVGHSRAVIDEHARFEPPGDELYAGLRSWTDEVIIAAHTAVAGDAG
jgi:hypothetical protein